MAALVFGYLLIRPLPVAAAETADCADFYTNRLVGVRLLGPKQGASSDFGFTPALCTRPGLIEISAGLAPELVEDERPMYLVVFNGQYLGPTLTHQVRNDVVCVVNADGDRTIYFDIPRDGYAKP
jgi:hypothetical protein